MICCVIGGALAAIVIARLSELPVVGSRLGRIRRNVPDPSNWRLDTRGELS